MGVSWSEGGGSGVGEKWARSSASYLGCHGDWNCPQFSGASLEGRLQKIE